MDTAQHPPDAFDGPPDYEREPRPTLVLTLGVLGLVMYPCYCFPFASVTLGALAWYFGTQDLRAMDAGLIDPDARGMTRAGQICGMTAVGLSGAVLLAWVAYAAVIAVMVAMK